MLLQVSNMSKSYGVTPVLSNISLQIEDRERIGLVGVNGAGKSTLLQIIAGELSYDDGDIFKAKETKVGYLRQNSGLNTARSIREEILTVFTPLIEAEKEIRELEQQMSDPALHENEKRYEETMNRYAVKSEWFKQHGGYEMEAKMRGVLHGMGFGQFAPETPIHTLSGGQKTRLALAKMLLEEPDLLILDEPTNHLDIPTLTWLEGYLRAYPGAILVVSHDRYFLDSLVTAIYEIERTSSKRYTGNYSRFVEIKAAEYDIQMRHYEKQQTEIARMEEFVQKNIVRATTTKRAQSRRKALEKMDRIDKPMGDLKRASFSFEVEQTSGKDVLEVRNLQVSVQARPGEAAAQERRVLIRDVNIGLTRGLTAALIGPNGIGKTTLLRTLIGDHKPDFGVINWGTNVKIGFYDQEQTHLNPKNSVLDEVWNTFPHLEEVRIRTVLGNFLFTGEDVFKKISSLSGGEKARVALAKLMLLKANVLVLDEPTNHLDLYAKEVLESALMDYEGTLLFISHDRYFLNKMAESMLELSSDGVQMYFGNYDDFIEKKAELAEIQSSAQGASSAGTKRAEDASSSGRAAGVSGPATSGTSATAQSAEEKRSDYEAGKQAQREARSKQRRLEALEANIAQLEAELEALEAEMADEAVFNDYVLLGEKTSLMDAKKLELEGCYTEWETLME